jgi:asparagine synthase (glutamine-hydrolysing)
VGYGWIDGIRKYTEAMVSDAEWNAREYLYPINTPVNKEGFFFRKIFQDNFNTEDAVKSVPFVKSIACSTPAALEWDEAFKKLTDESGRAVTSIHNQAYKENVLEKQTKASSEIQNGSQIQVQK